MIRANQLKRRANEPLKTDQRAIQIKPELKLAKRARYKIEELKN